MKRTIYLFNRKPNRKITFVNKIKGEFLNNKVAYLFRAIPIIVVLIAHLGDK